MTTAAPPDVLKLLAHDLRWQLVRLLAVGDYRVNELAELVAQPLNGVSYHLKQLRNAQLVSARRSEADGRDTYYSLDLDHLRAQFNAAEAALHPALIAAPDTLPPSTSAPHRLLFICTHNSARSQMAEGLMRHLSDDKLTVHSAGSIPGAVHPEAIRTLDALGIDIRQQWSKGFDALQDQPFDTIITVCDRAREVCPVFPGEGRHLHWGFPDPAAIQDPTQRTQAFQDTARRLQARIQQFLLTLRTGAAPS